MGAVAAVLGTFGLGAIASLVISYARKYGVKYAISFLSKKDLIEKV
ncbi:hypothetical protein BsIDN1_07200 [Bacillus safensis]|uniref:Uncharacterized protein n=1 Tax=Bacillus safensis TaxID=561879 RepID=A0A5S9M2Y9_BACIA|nr:hypothetical protein BsIDN1_07200 [Bacillus safensis]